MSFPVVLNTTYTWSNVIMKTWTLDDISVHFLVEFGYGSLTNPGKFANIRPHGRGEIVTRNFLFVFALNRFLTWNAASTAGEIKIMLGGRCTLVVTVEATRSSIALKNGEFFFPSKKSALGAFALSGIQQLYVIFLKKNLCFHPFTRVRNFQNSSLWRAFLKRCVFGDCFHWIRADDRPSRKNKSLISNKNGYMWTGIGNLYLMLTDSVLLIRRHPVKFTVWSNTS